MVVDIINIKEVDLDLGLEVIFLKIFENENNIIGGGGALHRQNSLYNTIINQADGLDPDQEKKEERERVLITEDQEV